jgi:hypothetical protein
MRYTIHSGLADAGDFSESLILSALHLCGL